MKKSKTKNNEAENEQMNAPAQTEKKDDFLIVGIGASAGGVQALKTFFENVAADSGAAYVVILHLSPDHDSRLTEILQAVAHIPVTRVKEKVKVEADNVYVVSPNESLSMRDGFIVVSPVHTVEERRAPVDIFFRTLGESHAGRSVAVVLSGTGANGSMGIKRVKEKGGAAFVQNPREAEFSEMPRNSIATELVDEVLNVAEIPQKIAAYKKNLGKVSIPVEPEAREEEQQAALREIFTLLKVRTGHDFANYKRPTVLRRIERRINVRTLASLPEYAAYLKENLDETNALLKDLLISVTNFFRDKEAFQNLERDVLPRILTDKTSKDQVRLWVAGCATGEEAYSMAMLLAEQIGHLPDAPKVQIFATDIDEDAIAAARAGFYTLNDAADVSSDRLRRFFTTEKSGYRVRRELREMVLFANHNLLKDPAFSQLDLVTCRNLLIYFNGQAQERVLETFHFALKPGGYLFLGSSESIDGAGDLFSSFNREQRIFQARQTVPRVVYPVPDLSPSLRFDQLLPSAERQKIESQNFERISYGDLHGRILEQFAPPSIVVSEDYDIVHVSPNAGRFLQIAGGEITKNLFKTIHPDLRLPVTTAVYQAAQNQTNVRAENLPVSVGGKNELINVSVRPVLQTADEATRGFILVVFEPTESEAGEREAALEFNEPLNKQLEDELLKSQTRFRQSIEHSEIQAEELKASNEELQAINEELRSTTEELETGKEELQSVNEELVTVNQELKIKIEELSNSNNDFRNLMNSSRIGTIFLDRRFRVKMFTPPAGEIFNLISSDNGRVLSDITHKLIYENLTADIEAVLDNLQPIEREVRTTDGNFYLMQITPYRTAEDRINGTIIAFVNITPNKRQEIELRESEEHLRIAVEAAEMGTWSWNLTNDEIHWNERHFLLFGMKPRKNPVRPEMFFNHIHEDDREWVGGRLKESIEKRTVFNAEFRARTDAGEIRWMEGYGQVVETSGGAATRMSGVMSDVTERRKFQENLSESEERLRLIMNSVEDYAIITSDTNGIISGWNTGAEKTFGYAESEIIGKSADILFTPEDREKGRPEKEMRTAAETGSSEDERWHLRKDGTRFYVSGVMQPLKDGKIDGFVKVARDLTERIKIEQIERDKEMLQKLVGAQEDERKRIARDLHDELGQKLTALRLKLENVRKSCEDTEICGGVDEAQLLAKQIDDGVDFLAWELRPAALDDLGLVAAMENYIGEWSRFSNVSSEFRVVNLEKERLMPEIETNLYRITQEALNNTHKYAAAKRAEVSLEKRDDAVILIIEDDGVGFNVENKKNRSKGIGLIGIEERAALVGGSVEIESSRGGGTRIFVRVSADFLEKEKNNE